jgi:hypothetical protein
MGATRVVTEEFPIEEIEDYNLYYKFVRNQDELVPYEKMVYRLKSQREAHLIAIDNIEQSKKFISATNKLPPTSLCLKYEWHKELARRADRRMRNWMELEAYEKLEDNYPIG